MPVPSPVAADTGAKMWRGMGLKICQGFWLMLRISASDRARFHSAITVHEASGFRELSESPTSILEVDVDASEPENVFCCSSETAPTRPTQKA